MIKDGATFDFLHIRDCLLEAAIVNFVFIFLIALSK